MEIGVDSFAAIIPDPATGKIISAAERMEHLPQISENRKVRAHKQLILRTTIF
jgi:hypothetical protein